MIFSIRFWLEVIIIIDMLFAWWLHEVMIIPEEGFEAGELSELVSTCNSELFTEANSEDILSDKVQWCSMDGEILRRAENE